MSIYDNATINFADSRVVEFLRSHATPASIGQTLELSPIEEIKNRGMIFAEQRPEPGASGNVTLVTAIRRTYSITQKLGLPSNPNFPSPPNSGSMEIHKCKLVLPITNVLEVSIATVLGVVKDSLVGTEIADSFTKFQPQKDGPVELFIAKKITELALKEPKVHEKYALFTKTTLKIIDSILDDSQETRLFDLYRENSKGVSIPGVLSGIEQNLGDLGYRISQTDEEYLADLPGPKTGEGLIVVPEGTDDATKLNEVLKRSEIKGSDCQGLVQVTPIKIASFPASPGTKTEWKWSYIKVCGGGFHFWKPIAYIQEKDDVYYVTLSYTANHDAVIDVLKSCLIEAAIDTAIISILTSDFDEAAERFLTLFIDKVKERLHRLYDCLYPKLYTVREEKEWRMV